MISNKEYIHHILDEINFLLAKSKALEADKFLNDETLQRAFVRSLEIIGEATKKISSELKLEFPDIEWKSIAGTRDKLIHDYIGVDYEIVWDIIQNKIPKLGEDLQEILTKLTS